MREVNGVSVVRSISFENDRRSKGYLHLVPQIVALFPAKSILNCDVRHDDGCPSSITGIGADCDCYPDIKVDQLEPAENPNP